MTGNLENKIKLPSSWRVNIRYLLKEEWFLELWALVKEEYLNKTIFPPPKKIFSALELCLFEDIKVVIIGQDPYHGEGQANGMCFSVPDGMSIPPSLKNIYKEIESDIGKRQITNGDLKCWADQGVLLLNSILTVVAHSPASHKNIGWEKFTDGIIKKISDEKNGVVFLLWGNYAKSKSELIDGKKHLILKAPHPSPFSVHTGFFGCKHFSQANKYLISKGGKSIDW